MFRKKVAKLFTDKEDFLREQKYLVKDNMIYGCLTLPHIKCIIPSSSLSSVSCRCENFLAVMNAFNKSMTDQSVVIRSRTLCAMQYYSYRLSFEITITSSYCKTIVLIPKRPDWVEKALRPTQHFSPS
jgi:hypothetical protein